MNLGLMLRVLGRFRFLILGGLVLASAAALLSHMRITFDGSSPRLEYRTAEQWQSTGKMLLTETDRGDAGFVSNYAGANRLASLAPLYAELAQADAVKAIMYRNASIRGGYSVQAMIAESGAPLPMLAYSGLSDSAKDAQAAVSRAMDAFAVYLKRLQDENEVPRNRRVEIQVVDAPQAGLIEGRRMTRPIFLFILIMTATIVLAFALENLRPRLRAAPPLESAEIPKLVSEAPRSRA
jgi:hypothetical protein